MPGQRHPNKRLLSGYVDTKLMESFRSAADSSRIRHATTMTDLLTAMVIIAVNHHQRGDLAKFLRHELGDDVESVVS